MQQLQMTPLLVADGLLRRNTWLGGGWRRVEVGDYMTYGHPMEISADREFLQLPVSAAAKLAHTTYMSGEAMTTILLFALQFQLGGLRLMHRLLSPQV